MVTFIVGPTGKSLIAKGIAGQLEQQGKKPFIFHANASAGEIKAAIESYSDVIVCWNTDVPQEVGNPDIFIDIQRPGA